MRRRADTRHCWERLTEHCHNAFFLSHTTQSQLLSTNAQIHKYTNHKYKYTKSQILTDRTLPQCFLSLTHHPVTTPPSAQLVKEPVCTESRNTVISKWVLCPTNIALVGNLFILFWKSIWYSQWQMLHIPLQKVWVTMIKARPIGIAPCLRNVSNIIFTNRQVSVVFQHFIFTLTRDAIWLCLFRNSLKGHGQEHTIPQQHSQHRNRTKNEDIAFDDVAGELQGVFLTGTPLKS